jgi:ubiquinone/menaquinone biosynthesis C-methylase UbiE
MLNVLHLLQEKKDSNLDAPGTTLQHRNIILRKKFLKRVYIYWYQTFIKLVQQNPGGKFIEIGSGGGFLNDLDSRIITSDILSFSHCNLTFSAENMPFENQSVDGIFMIDVLHHIPDCERFFSEAERVLKPGGKIIMIEPANTCFSRFVFQHFHHENFDPEAITWSFPTSGPLSGANGALPWIVFKRDRAIFSQRFSSLSVENIKLHTPFAYLISGGLSFKSPLPGWMFPVVKMFEFLLSPLNRWIAMFQTVSVVRREE